MGEDKVNIAYRLRAMAQAHPHQRALVFPSSRDSSGRVAYTQLTFRQLDQESDRVAHGLAEIGIDRGVRTILMVKPSLDFFILTFAMFKVGAVPVVVDPGMGVKRMLACLEEGQAQGFIGLPLAHVLRKLAPGHFKGVRAWLTVGRRWFWGGPTLKTLFKRPLAPFPLAETGRNETAAILFTTGSTGPAKGVVYTHGHFDAQIRHIQEHFQIQPGEIDLPTFPLFALFDPALGMTAVIPDMDPTRPAQVNPDRIFEPIINQGVTNMFASPALLRRVGQAGQKKGLKLETLKRVVSAGAPVAPALIETFASVLESDAQVHTPYGATEAVPIVSLASREILSETKAASETGQGMCVGRPLNGIKVALIRITDAPIPIWSEDILVPDGKMGEIVVQGELVTAGYFNRPEADALAKIKAPNGFWHRMGDVGYKDRQARIWFCGRKSHRVASEHGVLFTIPCEAVFNRHPLVFRSALVGIGPKGNQKPVIIIELQKNIARPDPTRLIQELKTLARDHDQAKTIHDFLFHPAFPVDIRHNAKIFREKLAVWAAGRLADPKASLRPTLPGAKDRLQAKIAQWKGKMGIE